MFNILTGLAMGIVIFAITIGVGVVVLQKFADANASCASAYTYNATLQKCVNATQEDPTDPANAGWTTVNSLKGEMGTSGLAGWTAAIVALAVGLLFIGALMGRKER